VSKCLAGRTALLALRKPGHTAREVTVVFPSSWKRSALLRYVRSEHPGETVRILEWHQVAKDDSWEPALWICNPDGFSDYRTGRRESDRTSSVQLRAA
jgi:hypothetical protein